jgi:hypothetical protein
MGKFFVKAKTNNQKGATPMQSKLKPSQQKSKLIDQIISNKAYGGFEDLVTASVELRFQESAIAKNLLKARYSSGLIALKIESKTLPPRCMFVVYLPVTLKRPLIMKGINLF